MHIVFSHLKNYYLYYDKDRDNILVSSRSEIKAYQDKLDALSGLRDDFKIRLDELNRAIRDLDVINTSSVNSDVTESWLNLIEKSLTLNNDID